MPALRGFILQPTYRVESGTPVLQLHGRLEDGRAFLVRDRRGVPRFYVEATDADAARAKGAVRQAAQPLADELSIEHLVCSELEVQEQALTGEFERPQAGGR